MSTFSNMKVTILTHFVDVAPQLEQFPEKIGHCSMLDPKAPTTHLIEPSTHSKTTCT